jgi:hypothetical protein
MAIVTANQNALQPATGGFHGNLKVAYGKYTYAAAPSANDLANLFKLPKNALVVGGYLMTDDIDTGTEALEIDVGWTANGGASTDSVRTNDGTTWTNDGYQAVSAGFVDSGVLTGDAITDLAPAGQNYRPFQLKTGPKFFTEETQVQAKITAAANAGGTGTVYVVAHYILI